MTKRGAWRWQNIPAPEPHTAGLVGSLILHTVWPRRLGGGGAVRAGGAVLLTAGTAMAAWATASAGTSDLERPDRLVTDGPYAYGRNPMYVGWALAYVGVAALTNNAWPLILLPAVAAAMHQEVRGEEQRLAARFGIEYEAYADQVRRYV